MLSSKKDKFLDELLSYVKFPNSFLDWICKITNVIIILFVILNICISGPYLLISLFNSNPINDIPKENIVYKMDVNQKVKLDDRVIHFTSIIYKKMEIWIYFMNTMIQSFGGLAGVWVQLEV